MQSISHGMFDFYIIRDHAIGFLKGWPVRYSPSITLRSAISLNCGHVDPRKLDIELPLAHKNSADDGQIFEGTPLRISLSQ